MQRELSAPGGRRGDGEMDCAGLVGSKEAPTWDYRKN